MPFFLLDVSPALPASSPAAPHFEHAHITNTRHWVVSLSAHGLGLTAESASCNHVLGHTHTLPLSPLDPCALLQPQPSFLSASATSNPLLRPPPQLLPPPPPPHAPHTLSQPQPIHAHHGTGLLQQAGQ